MGEGEEGVGEGGTPELSGSGLGVVRNGWEMAK